jgi:chemotaxis response regulator CheB
MLPSLFSKGFRSDVVYLVFQHMPNAEFMDVLVQCMQDELSGPIINLKNDEELRPGTIYFLPQYIRYKIKDNWIKIDDTTDKFHGENHSIDLLLNSAAQSDHYSTVIVLSGVLLNGDGKRGILSLKGRGAKILASSKRFTPVYSMIEELQDADLIDEFYPLGSLAVNLDFAHGQPLSPAETHLLVVDDEKKVREVIRDILHFEKVSCDFASDGLEALRKVQKTKYAGILLDIKMPELNGLQTLDALRTIEPEIPITIITGYDDNETHKASENPNVTGILLKPFTGEDIKKHLRKMQNRKTAD